MKDSFKLKSITEHLEIETKLKIEKESYLKNQELLNASSCQECKSCQKNQKRISRLSAIIESLEGANNVSTDVDVSRFIPENSNVDERLVEEDMINLIKNENSEI